MNRVSGQQGLFIVNIVLCVLVIAYSLYSLACYGLDWPGHPFWGIPRMQPEFADLRLLTHSADCDATVQELLNNIVNCDPFERTLNYPPITLGLSRLLGINADSTPLLGFSQGVLAIVGVSFAFLNLSKLQLNARILLLTLCIGSFPFQLALERGNYDLWVLILLLPLGLLIEAPNPSPLKKWTIATLSFWLAALKIFPLAGIICWSIWQRQHRLLNRAYLWLICPAIAGVALQATAVPTLLRNTQKSTGALSFGLQAVHQGSFWFAIALALKSITILVCLILWLKLLTQRPLTATFRLEHHAVFSLALWIMIPVYILSSSFDYRLLFLLLALPMVINLFSCVDNAKKQGKRLSWLVGISIVFIAYEQYLSGKIGAIATVLSDSVIQPALFISLILGLVLCSVPSKHNGPEGNNISAADSPK